jgi:hypothetical protein
VTLAPPPFAVDAAVGVPETWLPAGLLTRLPGAVARAPWTTRCEVVTWLHPVEAAAAGLVPEPIRPEKVALVAWALVRYADTPVGPYSEIAATVIPADADANGVGHIPFIVVDSLPSIVGGRVNWLLPKSLGRFEWSPDAAAVTITPEEPAAPAWSMTVRVSGNTTGDTTGDEAAATDVSLPNRLRQVAADGRVGRLESTLSGSLRPVTIEVDAHAEGPLSMLLQTGRHDGSLLRDCRFEVGPLTD